MSTGARRWRGRASTPTSALACAGSSRVPTGRAATATPGTSRGRGTTRPSRPRRRCAASCARRVSWSPTRRRGPDAAPTRARSPMRRRTWSAGTSVRPRPTSQGPPASRGSVCPSPIPDRFDGGRRPGRWGRARPRGSPAPASGQRAGLFPRGGGR